METGSRVYQPNTGQYGTVLGIITETLADGCKLNRLQVRPDGESADVEWWADSVRCPADEERRYRIVRHYFRGGSPRTIARGLTLAEAQAHCSNPETSSSTATGSAARARTRRMGAWFDGYTDRG